MPEEKQLSTVSNPPGPLSKGERAVAVPTTELLQKCPVAQRLYDRTGDGLPLAAVAVVAAADRSITTATESVRSTGQVSVKRFAKDFEERTLAALILTHLTIVEDMVNVARPLKPEAMAMLSKEVARMLVEDDMQWNLADIQIVADRLANGDAGQVYGGLNKAMVMKAFLAYMGEKCDAFVALREEQAREHSFGDFGAERGGTAQLRERMKNVAALAAYNEGNFKKDIKQ